MAVAWPWISNRRCGRRSQWSRDLLAGRRADRDADPLDDAVYLAADVGDPDGERADRSGDGARTFREYSEVLWRETLVPDHPVGLLRKRLQSWRGHQRDGNRDQDADRRPATCL